PNVPNTVTYTVIIIIKLMILIVTIRFIYYCYYKYVKKQNINFCPFQMCQRNSQQTVPPVEVRYYPVSDSMVNSPDQIPESVSMYPQLSTKDEKPLNSIVNCKAKLIA
ncbi:hypothetical protein, partial [Klebsiella pneumoniae]|uniref:hypothetical protein n=1 Tax=Klebsiella pneumoniae TaxID=573 RepID=UPI0019D70DA5